MKLLLLLLTGVKFGKLLTTSGTMLLSVAVYALMFGWRYAAGFVALLFCHELGHYIAAKQRKLPVGPITFIPFLGAWIELKEQPMNVETEAYVGLGGPFVGTLAAFLCYEVGRMLHSPLWIALAYAGFMLNLFNLIPLMPFDGGRITRIVSQKMWLVGAPVLIGLFLIRPSPMLIVVAVLALPHVLAGWRGAASNEPPQYHDVPSSTRLQYGAIYLALVGYLAMMTYETYSQLPRHS